MLCCSQVSFVAPSFTYLGVESILVPFKQFVDICFCSILSCSLELLRPCDEMCLSDYVLLCDCCVVLCMVVLGLVVEP